MVGPSATTPNRLSARRAADADLPDGVVPSLGALHFCSHRVGAVRSCRIGDRVGGVGDSLNRPGDGITRIGRHRQGVRNVFSKA